MTEGNALQARQIVKRFGGVPALKEVNFECRGGEVHALLGENGAGKSTLIRILTGAMPPDAGMMLMNGTRLQFRTPKEARQAGIGVVYQDFHLFPQMSVAECVYASSQNSLSKFGFLSRRAMRTQAATLLGEFGIDVDPARKVMDLDAAERKLIEIARALVRQPKYLFLDEPTSALEPRETHRLLDMIRRLRNHGTGVILVTHRLGEVVEVADRATVLRDGRLAGTIGRQEFSGQRLAAMIVGEQITAHVGPQHDPGPVRLSARDLVVRTGGAGIAMEAAEREIVAVIGLIGSGTSALLDQLAGVQPARAGTMRLNGAPYRPRSPGHAQRYGVGFVPQDRKGKGLIPLRSCAENIALPSLSRLGRAGLVQRRGMDDAAQQCQQTYNIRWQSARQPVVSLSGGNQQKVMLSRWIVKNTQVLVIQEPSQGVDIGARLQIHNKLISFAEAGGTVIFSSSDLDEVRSIAHRIYVMHAGSIVNEFDNRSAGGVASTTLTQAMAALAVPDSLESQ